MSVSRRIRVTDRPTERRHPAATGLQDRPPEAALTLLLDAQIAAAGAVRPAIPALAQAARAAASALGGGGRLIYAGAGSSGLMALADCLELAGTFGIAPDRTPMLLAGGTAALLHLTGAVEDDAGLAQADLDRVRPGPGDVVLCLSASGGTPYTLAVAAGAQAAGACVVGMACVPGSALLTRADIAVLLDSGPEVVAGSTRMGAATAQKIALNLFSVLLGLHLGHVHEGFMVNLVADNAKLADRAARIVSTLAGVPMAASVAALDRAQGAVKPAVLVAAGQDPDNALRLLAAHAGHLGPALAGLRSTENR
jgi:N-acetylmuramic acid 6-phosphate etherase